MFSWLEAAAAFTVVYYFLFILINAVMHITGNKKQRKKNPVFGISVYNILI